MIKGLKRIPKTLQEETVKMGNTARAYLKETELCIIIPELSRLTEELGILKDKISNIAISREGNTVVGTVKGHLSTLNKEVSEIIHSLAYAHDLIEKSKVQTIQKYNSLVTRQDIIEINNEIKSVRKEW